ncbi:MAG: hypothetical protein ACLQNE_32195 [Thermoguttaceae bacterium]
MSRKHLRQHWTEEEVKAAIAKVLADEPDGPNKEYWTSDLTIQDVKAHHGLKKFKPEPVTVTLVRKCCGKQFVHMLKYKRETKSLKDFRCFAPECQLKVVLMPFGKFKGQTLPWIYERSPPYLAWFHETVDGCEEIKVAIRALDGIEAHLAAFRQRRHPSQKRLTPTQQQVEWLMGKFSVETVDKVCEELFGGEGCG